ncbi:hypothetical protein M409DRAFT_58735 [Zasmidium cellare ATCC 36951]|uniref:CAP-Gly domain-containing protein n=1 Tax=Zasmidium cellare ATCC 36951 TaxID=1080233 RepID=A0A6A6C488_ZASCE|nr:uncharacterized protein M409DRAFT_58735 [Zasmidium cellare ATCC 36951]KAF2161967.1 hypothetical protein M409DRAFT_58735 [Zasmidium cellare ATCC 36951]
MSLQTPRQRGLQRPSFGNTNTASSPSLRASTTADVNRKASLRTLNGNQTPTGKMDGGELEVGDTVNVPGDMYGTVKFIGNVRGKNGKFVGVELDREFAARGKNDGDVDGVHYFNTSIPGAGIFLPIHRAEKRHSPTGSNVDSFPGTPNTPSYSTINGQRTGSDEAFAPQRSALKFSQSVGPGAARPSSPTFKPKRPSLPRPESPFRKQPPNLAPTPARTLSTSTRGTPRAGFNSANTPSKNNLKTSTSRPSTANGPARPYSRTGSRLGHRQDTVAEEERTPVGVATTSNGRTTSSGSVPSFSQPLRSGSRLGSAGGQDEEVLRLKTELAERDKRLAEQAANLSDMEASVKELSALIPTETSKMPAEITGDESTGQLRQILREKNEKITILTSEFDAHRADFRSTLDSLEMASTETERVYEEQKRDLLAQVQELSERNQELEDMNQNKKEFDDVARQLKQLEDFVQELEEGLEDARRGEAEARGEVEFLRGEVERGRSELKREREKAASAVNGSSSTKELEQKEDEIRGLKAIIHSFSTSPDATSPNGFNASDELQRLQGALTESQKQREQLEAELEQLRRDSAMSNGHHARNESEMTATANNAIYVRPRGNTLKATFAEHAARRIAADGEGNGITRSTNGALFCEMCESSEHDTLDCTQFQQNHDTTSTEDSEAGGRDVVEVEKPLPLSPGKENEGVKATKDGKTEDKWCALCEKDGHLAYECPDEQY